MFTGAHGVGRAKQDSNQIFDGFFLVRF